MNISEEKIKKISCAFFRSWYNSPGNNTEQGFDEWWEKEKHWWIKKKPIPHLNTIIEIITKYEKLRADQNGEEGIDDNGNKSYISLMAKEVKSSLK